MPLVLNITWFWVCQGYTWFWICLNMPGKFLNISDYVWICQDTPEFVGIWLHLPGSCFTFSHCDLMCTWTRVYLFQRLHETRCCSLKEHESVFSKRQNLIFFYSSWKYLISNFLFEPRNQRSRAVNLDIPNKGLLEK